MIEVMVDLITAELELDLPKEHCFQTLLVGFLQLDLDLIGFVPVRSGFDFLPYFLHRTASSRVVLL